MYNIKCQLTQCVRLRSVHLLFGRGNPGTCKHAFICMCTKETLQYMPVICETIQIGGSVNDKYNFKMSFLSLMQGLVTTDHPNSVYSFTTGHQIQRSVLLIYYFPIWKHASRCPKPHEILCGQSLHILKCHKSFTKLITNYKANSNFRCTVFYYSRSALLFAIF